MNLKKRSPIEFTSSMSTPQKVITLLWIAVHVLLIPFLITSIPQLRPLSAGQKNLIWYVTSTTCLVIINFTFLRRDFDTIVDNLGKVLMEILTCYTIIVAIDLIISALLNLYMTIDGSTVALSNENNNAIMNQSQQDSGMVKACAIFLAPIAEELIFRGGIFGTIRKYNRLIAYLVAIALFSVYHVWSYAMEDPTYWVYVLQYIPISYVLCRCYERTNSIWGSILFHMSWNAITLTILNSLA